MNIDRLLNALYAQKNKRIKNDVDWETIARPEQLMPAGDWFGWFIMAGRGFGKTRTGAETVKKLVLSNQYKRICLLGETYDQVRSIMIEGESGLLNVHKNNERPKYKQGRRELVWENGAIATCYSAENYEALRGPQFDLAWIDELAKFDNDEKVWDQLMFCLRLGNAPKVIITTTPRPKKLIFDLTKRTDIHLTRGTTFDNANNLPKNFMNMIAQQYGNTQIGQQEIEGALLLSDSSALWNYLDFSYMDLSCVNQQLRALNEHEIIIAIDPAMSTKDGSDETGIIVASKHKDCYYVLEDASGIMKPEIWAHKAYELYKKYQAREIIVEINQGGEVLLAMLESFANAPWKGVRAKESKYKRAVPISSLYKQKKVVHAHKFEKLEEQMIKAHVKFADDRLDALVWALYSLMQIKNSNSSIACW